VPPIEQKFRMRESNSSLKIRGVALRNRQIRLVLVPSSGESSISCPCVNEFVDSSVRLRDASATSLRRKRHSPETRPASENPIPLPLAGTHGQERYMHSCSSLVRLCCTCTLLPLVTAPASSQRAMRINRQRRGLFSNFFAWGHSRKSYGNLHQNRWLRRRARDVLEYLGTGP